MLLLSLPPCYYYLYRLVIIISTVFINTFALFRAVQSQAAPRYHHIIITFLHLFQLAHNYILNNEMVRYAAFVFQIIQIIQHIMGAARELSL